MEPLEIENGSLSIMGLNRRVMSSKKKVKTGNRQKEEFKNGGGSFGLFKPVGIK